MLWGVGGLRVVDPYFQIPIKLSARGQYGIRISDGALFLKKLIGTIESADTDLIEDQFRIDAVEAVKVTIATFMKDNNVNINELGSEYKALAKAVSKELQSTFNEYGVQLLNFNVEDINFDETDKGYQTVMEGIAEQAKLSKLGINYYQQKQLDIAQTAAGNEGAGTFMGIGMGLGVGNNIGAMVGETVRQNTQVVPPPQLPTYYIAQNGQTKGPFSVDIIQGMIQRNEVTPTTYVYKVGGHSWVLANSEPEIAQLLSLMTPPPPPTL